MGKVTNLILVFSSKEEETVDGAGFEIINEVNRYFEDQGSYGFINKWLPSDSYGGTRHLEAPIFIGAFEDLNVEKFLAHLNTLPWEETKQIQVMVKGEEDLKCKIFGWHSSS